MLLKCSDIRNRALKIQRVVRPHPTHPLRYATDEIASDYCDMFDKKEEDPDEATHQCLTNQCMNQHQEKDLC